MQVLKIQFPDNESRTRGFYELMQRVRVICLPNDEFVIPETSLVILTDRHIPYTVIARPPLDDALKTLRNSAASLL